MTRPLTLLWCGLACCAQPQFETRHLWTTEDFAGAAPDALGVTGWRPAQLVEGAQLRALPAFTEGRAVAFVITELWHQSPNPWVQPTYVDTSAAGSLSIFSVGTRASFYSPFWRVTSYENPGEEKLQRAKQVLDRGGVLTPGDIAVCPIVPADTSVERVHPLTGQALSPVAVKDAWVEGAPVSYLALGRDRVRGEGDRLDEARLYSFVGNDGQAWSLPAVLDDDALHRSFARRYEVTLPPEARAFWPTSAPVPAGLTEVVGSPDPGLDSPAHRLRVATNPDCFRADAGFPAGCHWLDSRGAIEAAFAPSQVRRTETTVAATVLTEAQ